MMRIRRGHTEAYKSSRTCLFIIFVQSLFTILPKFELSSKRNDFGDVGASKINLQKL